MGKTRNLFKKIGNIKGTFHASMGTIKNRNSKDLTEAEEIKKWQEYTELYKKGLNNLDNHVGVVTHLNSECEVKWALGSITTKLLEVMEFQLSYLKSWKMMLWKCCTQYASKFGKLSNGHRTGKGQFSFQSQSRAMPKNVQTTIKIVLISHAIKVIFKILQVRLQQYVNQELRDVQAGFRKGKGTRDQTADIFLIIEKAREFQKNIYFASSTMWKLLTVWITANSGKFFMRWK